MIANSKNSPHISIGAIFTTACAVIWLPFVANGLEQYAKDHDNGQGNTGQNGQRERY